MKKVALIIDDFSCGGGTGRALSNCSLALPNDYQQVIISLYDEKYFKNKKIVSWEHNANQVINMGFKKRNRFLTLLMMPIHAYKLKKIKKRIGIDDSISFGYYSNDINCRSMFGKTIITIHIYFKKNIVYSLRYNRYKRADAIIGVSERIVDSLTNEYHFPPLKTRTIYNMFDINAIINKSITEDARIDNNTFNIAMVGRLEYQKAVHHAINIIHRTKNKNVKLYLFGEGVLETQLKELCSNLNICNQVIFMGFESDIYSYLKKCDLYLMTSLFEGFPMVNVEALACGLPVVSCDCLSGPQELLLGTNNRDIDGIVECGFGMIYPAFSDDDKYNENLYLEVAEYINRISNNPEKLAIMKKKAVERAFDFDKEKIISDWKSII